MHERDWFTSSASSTSRRLLADLHMLQRAVTSSGSRNGYGYRPVASHFDDEESVTIVPDAATDVGSGSSSKTNNCQCRIPTEAEHSSSPHALETVDSGSAMEVNGPKYRNGPIRRGPVSIKTTGHQVIELGFDCYATAAAEGTPLWLAAILPLTSAGVQFMILFFLAFDGRNTFAEGRWLEPFTPHPSVMAMKCLASVVTFFKVSGEFDDAQMLCFAILVGCIRGRLRIMCCWWALFLQCVMALIVLVVSFSLILAGQSCSDCFLRTLSLWLVIDVDNLGARFVALMWTLNFNLPNMAFAKPESDRSEEDEKRKQVRLPGRLRRWFITLPICIMLLEGFLAVFANILPLTYIQYGRVSNHASPQMLDEVPLMPVDKSSSTAEYTVLLLAPLGEPPPVIFWIALVASPDPQTPTSYQVSNGADSNSNQALQAGSVVAEPVQARFWLQSHGFPNDLYKQLARRKQLYKTTEPYVSNFKLQELPDNLRAYKVFATAQNPSTGALSPSVVATQIRLTSACGLNCDDCDESGAGFCRKCAQRSYQTEYGRCLACPDDCNQCTITEKRCDAGHCSAGYGLTKIEGICKSCGIDHCEACDGLGHHKGKCNKCEIGYGLNKHGYCQPCAHEKCLCKEAGACQACAVGWGLVQNRTHVWCRACRTGCLDCNHAGDSRCLACIAGFAKDSSGNCSQCAASCRNCTGSWPGCDECNEGYGLFGMDNMCSTCHVQDCLQCNEDLARCQLCRHGLGVTPDGKCEPCGEHCDHCDSVGTCKECEVGYAKHQGVDNDGRCWSCADQCASCHNAGPGLCDHCQHGSRLTAAQTCESALLGT